MLALIAGYASWVTGQESSPSSSAAPSFVKSGAAPTIPIYVVTVGKVTLPHERDICLRMKADLAITGLE